MVIYDDGLRRSSVPNHLDDDVAGPSVLVTGATGYIGGRLVQRLRRRGIRVRCVARDLGRLDASRWPGVEIVQGDLADENAALRVLDGIDLAYYLVHSMARGERVSRTRSPYRSDLRGRGPAGVCQADRLSRRAGRPG